MIPDYNNFYASFQRVTKAEVKNILIRNNWGCAKESWFDFNLTNDWSELILHGDETEPLISGAVYYSHTIIEILDRIFNLLPGSFVYEFYDAENLLLFERKKGLL
jgi:hypothetical protein